MLCLRWTADPDRACDVPIDGVHDGGLSTTPVNQSVRIRTIVSRPLVMIWS